MFVFNLNSSFDVCMMLASSDLKTIVIHLPKEFGWISNCYFILYKKDFVALSYCILNYTKICHISKQRKCDTNCSLFLRCTAAYQIIFCMLKSRGIQCKWCKTFISYLYLVFVSILNRINERNWLKFENYFVINSIFKLFRRPPLFCCVVHSFTKYK